MHRIVHDNHQPYSQERRRILVLAGATTVSPRFPLAWRCQESARVGDVAGQAKPINHGMRSHHYHSR